MVRAIFIVFILCVQVFERNCQTGYHIRQQLIERLMTNYSKHITPRFNQDVLVQVKIDPLMEQIIDFDESKGVFSWYGSFELIWTDDLITWNVSENGGITSIHVPFTDVWVPKLIIANSASKRTFYQFDNDFDYHTSKVSFDSDGTGYLLAGGIIDTSCDADIVYYPADYHICQMELHPETNEIELLKPKPNMYEIAMKYYEGDPEWDVTNITSDLFIEGGYPTLVFNFYIQRKPLHLIKSLILPLILVSVLNIFTFILPVESGERTSFAVTLFLTFAVVMTVVSDTFPATNKVSAFTIFLILRLITSGLTTIVAILSISVYFRNDEETWKNTTDKTKRRNKFQEEANLNNSIALPQLTCHRKSGKEISLIIDRVALVVFIFEIGVEFIVFATFFALR